MNDFYAIERRVYLGWRQWIWTAYVELMLAIPFTSYLWGQGSWVGKWGTIGFIVLLVALVIDDIFALRQRRDRIEEIRRLS